MKPRKFQYYTDDELIAKYSRPSRSRFDFDNMTTESIEAIKQSMFESNRKIFGYSYKDRYIKEIKRFNLPMTMGLKFDNPFLARQEAIKQIQIMTGEYAYNRARQARINLVTMLSKIGGNQASKIFALKLSLTDLVNHAEEYDYLFSKLEGYGGKNEEGDSDHDILKEVLRTFKEIQERRLMGRGVTWDEEQWEAFKSKLSTPDPKPEPKDK